jgi:AraC family transcriptional regulator
MSARLMMTVAGKTQPLTFDARSHSGPLLSSASTAWAGLPFELHRVGAAENTGEVGPLDGEYGLFVMMEGNAEFVMRENTGDVRYEAKPGAAVFVTSHQRGQLVRMLGDGTAVAVRITPEWYRRLALGDAPFATGAFPALAPDDTVHRIVDTMCNEVARNATTGPVFAEALSMALLSYITRRVPPASEIVRGHLSSAQCQKLRTHIRENLSGELSLVELATLVGLGPRYFSTLFRRAFGSTPHKYVMQQRLAEGARLLTSQALEISEVAVRVGFCSQSHFTAAFRQAYGVTPRRYLLDTLSRPEITL